MRVRLTRTEAQTLTLRNAGQVYCPLAHIMWTETGFLHKIGIIDFAGGNVVHVAAGFSGLVSSFVVGYLYVCMYVCMYIYIHICMQVCTHLRAQKHLP